MKVRDWVCASIFVIIQLAGVGGAEADSVRLNNGDMISGHVVRMEDGRLLLATSYAGEVTIAWEAIAALETDAPVLLVLEDGESARGLLIPADQGWLRVKSEDGEEQGEYALLRVAAVNPKEVQPPGWDLKGAVNAGVNVRRGNTETGDFHLDGNVVAGKEKNRYGARAEYNRSEDDGKKDGGQYAVGA